MGVWHNNTALIIGLHVYMDHTRLSLLIYCKRTTETDLSVCL